MSKLYIKEVLTKKQKAVFNNLKPLKKIGVLTGGTALAFQLKHRRSYDFDIFTSNKIPGNLSWDAKKIFGKKIKVVQDSENELTFFTHPKVKVTFFYYPFKPIYKIIKTTSISIFDWRDIAADKAYTLGRRPIWRDYVDLYFMIEKGHGLKKIIHEARKKFGGLFSEKLFLGQLIYFGGLQDFKIDFLGKSFQPPEIKKFFEKEIRKYKKEIL
ncbi:MAG: hypothetical protein COY72_00565 [Candidatus Nealsonbacteria bacterium CG_4_10_14_0_8_um_filter_35_10]|uniref:Nucleotidyl transferase AbiEii/AbiGii toxin family protein n=2 Tax=Candidatus Nealsoniibacteriota TaxID=1817911 RepID=A0A2M7R8P6_9BACT|nr:MAG: hypothetical protein AUJ24_01385 [Parcubacteria group bacterium CG1_02_36_42]PIY90972.1 MAG: hypothetical protein COY72_00565 [Candidatus Nealsonbacteria bacterium CG_4_10_14_0_8_um_filter_35_10]PJB99342.1 MAG: hypothetical protein CO077_02265 [Candidatus Nealsonbacteria bacterium CG_4_9_14_0_8_um_filter_35_12]